MGQAGVRAPSTAPSGSRTFTCLDLVRNHHALWQIEWWQPGVGCGPASQVVRVTFGRIGSTFNVQTSVRSLGYVADKVREKTAPGRDRVYVELASGGSALTRADALAVLAKARGSAVLDLRADQLSAEQIRRARLVIDAAEQGRMAPLDAAQAFYRLIPVQLPTKGGRLDATEASYRFMHNRRRFRELLEQLEGALRGDVPIAREAVSRDSMMLLAEGSLDGAGRAPLPARITIELFLGDEDDE